MKTYRVKIVDAFTQKQFAGNPAGVVLDANGLTDVQMQLIARELNLSETAFILPPTETDANLQIRWFTNNMEVPLCGHATIASFHALAEEGMEGMRTKGQHYFRLQTKSGLLAVRVEKNFYQTMTEFELPLPRFKIIKKLPEVFMKSIGLSQKELHLSLPIVRDAYLYIPVKKLSIIGKIQPKYQPLSLGMDKEKLSGICVFCLETVEKESAVHSRFFAPNCGIDEDPVTGSANGPLGYFLQKYVVPQKSKLPARILTDGRIEYIGEQGDAIQRPGRVKIRVKTNQKEIESISIVGEAVTIMDATIRI